MGSYPAIDKSAAFEKFKQACISEGLVPEHATAEGDDLISGICDDDTLFRFLRAREFEVDAALQQYKTTRQWRNKNNLSKLFETIEVDDLEQTRKLYTHWTGRRDRQGNPICLFEIQQLTSDKIAAWLKSCSSTSKTTNDAEGESSLRLFCLYENLTRFILPLCKKMAPEKDAAAEMSVLNTTNIVDITGVSLMQFWRLRSHMQAASTLATANYPETLGKTFILGAPSYFTIVWGWINSWFDANTVSKLAIVPRGKEFATMSDLINPADIPRKYGGEMDFEFGDEPKLDAQIENAIVWSGQFQGLEKSGLPAGPMRWIRDADGDETAIAVGSVNGEPRHSMVFKMRQFKSRA